MKHMLVLAALAYGIGQGSNFLFQLQLLHMLGAAQYGAVGLAHLLLMTLIFVADLGYGSLFLRTPLDHPQWLNDWRCALTHRLIASLLLLVLASLLITCQWRDAAASAYWIGAAPAALLALINYSGPLIVQGRQALAMILGQIAWPIALLLSTLPYQWSSSAATRAGLAVTLGFAVQALVHLAYSRRARLWLPRLGQGQLIAALRLSMLGICGTLHDRLTPLLLAPLAPGYFPWYLILSHALSGLSGIQAQLSRLLLPGAAHPTGRLRALLASSWGLWGSATALSCVLLLQALPITAEQNRWLMLSTLVLLAWGLSMASGFLSLPLISGSRERPLLRLLLISMSVSSLIQLAGAWAGSAHGLLWGKVLGALGMIFGLLGLLHIRFTAWGWTAILLSLLAAVASYSTASPWLALLMAAPVLIGLLGQRTCYQPHAITEASS